MAESLPLPLEPAASLVSRAQPHDAWVARELPRPLTAVAEPRAKRPSEQRVAAPEAAAPALAVAAPELDLAADSRDRAPPEPPQRYPQRRVEPDDLVGGTEHEVAKLALVVAVDHPAVPRARHELAHPRLPLLGTRLRPVR